MLPSFAKSASVPSKTIVPEPKVVSSPILSCPYSVISLVSDPSVIFTPAYAPLAFEDFKSSKSIVVEPEVYADPTLHVNGTRVVSNRYASKTAVLLVDVFVNAPEL